MSNNYRTDAMHIRDRIMYSRSFLRLNGKTQVYETNHDDHARNRLTHSLEVAQIARTIAIALNEKIQDEKNKIDCDLIEAIALAHDIGHTPFGHKGERQLNELLQFNSDVMIDDITKEKYLTLDDAIINANKGYKHNWQSIRILKQLCHDYCGGDMLRDISDESLKFKFLSGVLMHSSICKKDGDFAESRLSYYKNLSKDLFKETDFKKINQQPRWPGNIVNIADEIAQRHHDIEDAITFNVLSPDEIISCIWIDGMPNSFIEKKSDVENVKNNINFFTRQMSRVIVCYFVDNFVNSFNTSMINETKLDFTGDLKKVNDHLENTITQLILKSQSVSRMDSRGGMIVRRLFRAYKNNPLQLSTETLNSVFREYFRQTLWNLDYIHDGINNNVRFAYPANDNEAIKESVKLILYDKQELNLFENEMNCRLLFAEAFEKGIKLEIEGEYFYKAKNEQYNNIYVNKDWFRLYLLRVITDYIAGMTDSYAEKEYRKLYGVTHYILS